MTRKQFELRMKANIEKYVYNNEEAYIDAVMALYERIPDIGGSFKSLFRYRALNSYELESLENETIFMRWPSSYKDIGDCAPVFNFKEISKYIIEKKYPLLNAEKTFTEFINVDDIKENPKFKRKIDDMRNMWMIACFTEKYNNNKMWKEYAVDNTGICLVYSFLDILNKIKNTVGMSIMPVRYVDNRMECADISLNHKDLLEADDKSESKYQLMCTTKEKLQYSFEEEWRLILEKEKEDIDGTEIGKNIPFVSPKGIICGKLIDKKSAEYEKLLCIAKGKGIALL